MASKKLTPKQKQLVKLLPLVETGKMTLKAAMLEAGYSETTARTQNVTMGQIGSNSVMQKTLRDAGFTEKYLAEGILNGTTAMDLGRPDHRTRGVFYKLGAELLDAFPAQKNINADIGIEQLLDEQEAQSDHPKP